MIKATQLTQAVECTDRPSAIVQSHTRTAHFTTLNIGRTKADDGHTCTSLSITTSALLTAEDAISAIYKHNLYDTISAEELHDIAATLGVTDYDTLAALLIRGRYTVAEELACHRKALSGDTASLEELAQFVEQCKAMAKAATNS